jgi:hypothetical protein
MLVTTTDRLQRIGENRDQSWIRDRIAVAEFLNRRINNWLARRRLLCDEMQVLESTCTCPSTATRQLVGLPMLNSARSIGCCCRPVRLTPIASSMSFSCAELGWCMRDWTLEQCSRMMVQLSTVLVHKLPTSHGRINTCRETITSAKCNKLHL